MDMTKPCGHRIKSAGVGQYDPAGQGVVLTADPAAQYVAELVVLISGHSKQSLGPVLPRRPLKVPTGHDDATKEPRGQYAPTLQFWHADCNDAGLNEPATHGTAPVVLPVTQYVPAEHTIGAELPPAHEYPS